MVSCGKEDVTIRSRTGERTRERLFAKSLHAGVIPRRVKPREGQITMSRMQEALAFHLEVDKLKNVIRKTQNASNDRFENDAEHSWHICMMAMTLRQFANAEVDLLKVLQMLIVHDLGEIYGGDVIVHEKDGESRRRERESVERIISMFGGSEGEAILSLMTEFEERTTDEAKYANAIDRLEPVMQNLNRHGGTWKKRGISHNRIVEGSVRIWSLVKGRLDCLKEKGLID
jgi:putative hydrolase of HD superfamily